MATCPKCKAPAAAGACFCIRCGASLMAAAAPRAATATVWCDLCAQEVSAQEAAQVPRHDVVTLANSGYGEQIALWSSSTPAEKRHALERLAKTCAWPWHVCAACAQKVHAKKPAAAQQPAPTQPPRSVPAPITPATTAAAPNRAAPGLFRRLSGWAGRGLLLLLTFSLAIAVLLYLATSYRKTLRSEMRFDLLLGGDKEAYVPTPHPANGMHIYMGLFLGGLVLLMFNRTFRAHSGRGPIDWLLGFPRVMVPLMALFIAWLFYRPLLESRVGTGGSAEENLFFVVVFGIVIAVLVSIKPIPAQAGLPIGILVCATAILGLLGFVYQFHREADEAAFAFKTHFVSPTNAGNVLFGWGSDHQVHLAVITPDLVRALERHGVNVNESGTNDHRLPRLDEPRVRHADPMMESLARAERTIQTLIYSPDQTAHEYPLAGLLPIAWVLVLAVGALVARIWKGPLCEQQRALVACLFGFVNWYLVWWFASAVQDAWFGAGRSHFAEWQMSMTLMAPLGLIFTSVACLKICSAVLSDNQRAGWTTLFFLVQLGSIAGIFLVSFKTPGTPALPWLTAYLAASSACWILALPSWKKLRMKTP